MFFVLERADDLLGAREHAPRSCFIGKQVGDTSPSIAVRVNDSNADRTSKTCS